MKPQARRKALRCPLPAPAAAHLSTAFLSQGAAGQCTRLLPGEGCCGASLLLLRLGLGSPHEPAGEYQRHLPDACAQRCTNTAAPWRSTCAQPDHRPWGCPLHSVYSAPAHFVCPPSGTLNIPLASLSMFFSRCAAGGGSAASRSAAPCHAGSSAPAALHVAADCYARHPQLLQGDPLAALPTWRAAHGWGPQLAHPQLRIAAGLAHVWQPLSSSFARAPLLERWSGAPVTALCLCRAR